MRQLPLPQGFGALYACEAPGDEKQQHTAAYALLEEALNAYAARHGISLPQPLILSRTETGKPYLPGDPVHFNLSHCRGMAVCLLSDRPCGVDVEQRRPLRPKVVQRVFSEAEQAALSRSGDPDMDFTRLWTLKESYVKAIGIGVSYPMRTVCFSLEGDTVTSGQQDAVFWHMTEGDFSVSVCLLQNQAVTKGAAGSPFSAKSETAP